ncbi:TonB-dependent receptor [Haliea sp. E1-2-M8]|uniref:TonB-dependent receptor n=1 Tax=Haliea sp. E1-2-M8 TaxID=3064706 RepID=UPI0027235FEF|nr:TonB-dependent receptor [Haliea sp. E1-2-M8]MDO8863940.1 TonB-dependent receptor [Haliea sp. E1-2-M8]
MNRTFNRLLSASAAGAMIALGTTPSTVSAQGVLEEVVVTATKRAEGVQDIPLSVTVFSQNDMDLRGFSNLQGIQEATPNLNFSVQSAGQNVARVTLRGIGTETLVGGGDPGVAVHIDGVYVGRNSVAAGDIFDIARVEVLRGPQGTLYGRNATGGSINIITERPSREFEASVDLAIGNYDARRFRAIINGPITDSISARLALFSDKRDGFYDNLFNGRDSDDKDSLGGRLQFLWESESGNEILLRAYRSDFDSIGPGSTYLGDDIPPTATGYPAGYLVGVSSGPLPPPGAPIIADLYGLGTTAAGDPILSRPTELRDIRRDAPEFLDQTIEGIDLEANFMVSEGILLKSISSFQTNDNEILVDSDNSELPIQTRYRLNEAEQYSQEFNLISQGESRFHWILGAFYYHEELTETFNTSTPAGLLPLTTPLPPGAVPGGGGAAQDRIALHEVDSYALFAQLSYDLSERTSVTVGLRQTWDEKQQDRPTGGQIDLTNNFLFMGRGATGPLPPSTAEANFSELTYRVSVDYALSDDNMLFASVSNGYKSGGFDFNGGVLEGDEQVPYEPEFVDAYEVGSKNKFYDDRFILNLTAFYYDYSDLQVFRLTGDGPLTDNAAQSTIWGLEAETEFLITEAFHVDASVGHLDATYDEYLVEVPPPTQDFSGKTLNYAPEWTAHVGAEYTAMVGQDELIFRVDWSYRSDTYFDRANTDFDTQDAYSLVNARVRYNTNKWFADVFAQNLTDKEYVTGQLINPPFACGCRTVNVGAPRTYGVTVGYRWD